MPFRSLPILLNPCPILVTRESPGLGCAGSEDIFRIHTRVVDAQTTIPAGNNAICAGPIELTANLIVEGTLTIV